MRLFAFIALSAIALFATSSPAMQAAETSQPWTDRDAADSIAHRGSPERKPGDESLRPLAAPEPNDRNGWRSDGALAVRAFASCLAERRHQRSRDYLATSPNTDESAAAARRVAGRFSTCLTFSDYPVGTLWWQDQALRGALSEAMYLRAHPERPPVAILRADVAPIGQDVFAVRMGGAGDPAQELIRMFAECLVNRQPTIADTLLRSEFRSEAEREILAMFAPQMAACLFEGQTLSIGPENLRFALADALYRAAEPSVGESEYSGVSE